MLLILLLLTIAGVISLFVIAARLGKLVKLQTEMRDAAIAANFARKQREESANI